MTTSSPPPLLLSTRRGKLTLVFLCVVGFLDFVDNTIVNVAAPSISRDLHFSVQNLQWVVSGYLLTYGGFLLLGGRAGDLLGRRRILVTGTTVFALSSIACGLAQNSGTLVYARLVQGLGAALMTPAALSILTTKFNQGTDRLKALGAWGGIAGLSSGVGVFLGGALSGGPGWRWVFFVNPPICLLVLLASFWLIDDDRSRARLAHFDIGGATLVTGAMLLTIYSLIRAPEVGWGNAHTLAGLAVAAVLMLLFVLNERRHSNPLVPFSIFRIRGLVAADLTQILAMAAFFSMFFFSTLYMQDVLRFSPMKAGAAYIPVTIVVAISATVSSKLFARTGTRPITVIGALIAAGGVFWLARVPVHGTYLAALLPGLLITSAGFGAVFVGVQTAANAGVPPDKAGLAAALVNASFQLGSALGLAIFSGMATSRTQHLLAAHTPHPEALASGFRLALLASSVFLVGAALVAMRATNTRGEPVSSSELGSVRSDVDLVSEVDVS